MKKQAIQSIISFRHELHKHPELSHQETATSDRVKDFFASCSPDQVIEGLGGNGLAVVFNGKQEGPTTLLRAELDALPIPETGKKPYNSIHPGISHTCGHDGHMAILAGVGSKLATAKPEKGKVVLLFQPAEETGEGAELILKSPAFKGIQPDMAFALHNLPGYEMQEIVLKKGAFTAASKGMTVQLTGETSHAAHPEDGNPPTEALAKLMVALEKLSEGVEGFSLITVVHVGLGERSFGTTPGAATLMATLRTFDNSVMDRLTAYAEQLVHTIAKSYKLEVAISYSEAFEAVENDAKAWEHVNESAKKLTLKTKHIRLPFRWSEDFGRFSAHCPTFLFGIGAGTKHPQLHESSYDFPDEIMPTAIELFWEVIQRIHS
ncbi:MAG: amidohydrolase [Lunatimonas sp.]|uniref:amidohydrolase n=1 Tax=Lunatimonas sp. TaxID=2060141 RepID=UPI00263AAEBE|nr:amidohydrolase [Lunatimonas sp.]MCC5939597.1 amidohydrolase [Lunatimonas sp.]